MAVTVRETDLKPGYKQTEIGVIPEGWEVAPLIGLVVIQHGYGFQSQYFKPFGKYRLTTPGHFHETGGFYDVGEKQKFYEGPLPEGYLLSEGDLIVAMTEQMDGLLGSAAIVPIDNTYLHNQRLGKVKILSANLDTIFLYHFFNSNNYRAKVRETAAGTKVKHTSPSKLLEIPIPLPPLPEQQAIATALSDLEALITSLDKLIAKKRDIKQATMQELLTGKTRLPGFSGEWETKKLDDVVEVIIGGGTPSRSKPEYWGGNIPWTTVKDFATFNPHGTQESITEVGLHNSSANLIKKGTIITSTRMALGKAVIYDVEVSINQDLKAIILKKNINTLFIFYWFEHNAKNIENLGSGSTVKGISLSDLKNISLLKPPTIEEQQAIATILSDMDAEIVALERKRDKTRALKQGMMQELLTGKTRLYEHSRPDRAHDAESSGQSLQHATEL